MLKNMPDLNHGDDEAAVNALRSAVMRLSRLPSTSGSTSR